MWAAPSKALGAGPPPQWAWRTDTEPRRVTWSPEVWDLLRTCHFLPTSRKGSIHSVPSHCCYFEAHNLSGVTGSQLEGTLCSW